jgi:hypothetical protein
VRRVTGLWRGVLLAVGVLIALCSAFFVVTALVEVASGGDGKTSPGVYAGLVIFFLGTGACGAFLIWRAMRDRSASRITLGSQPTSGPARPGQTGAGPARPDGPDTAADRERRILQFAEAEKGRVTVAEVAAHCRLTVTQAKTDLDRLVLQQVAELQVTENGVLVYVFPGFLSDEDKASARDF